MVLPTHVIGLVMRRACLGTLAVFATLATSALAQSFVDSELDGTSGMPHRKVQAGRARLSTAVQPDNGYTIPQVIGRSGNFGVGGPHHSGGTRKGRTAGDSILDRGICIGC